MPKPDRVPPPDLSSRPLSLKVARMMRASAERLYLAWTEQLDLWLAAPGSVLARGEEHTAFYFETHHGAFRAPYYGRFLRLERPRLVEMTWLSLGTGGAETVLTIELVPIAGGVHLTLTQTGFASQQDRDEHELAWPQLLAELDGKLMLTVR